MLRTTIYLGEEEALALKRLSQLHHRPQSELIREAITKYVREQDRKHARPLPTGAGMYRSGRSDVSSKAEQLLKKKAKSSR